MFYKLIKNKFKKFKSVLEKFNMKAYNLLQIETATRLSKMYKYKNVDDFFHSDDGKKFMIYFREILLNKYGSDENNPKNPNIDEDILLNKKEKEKLINYLINKINEYIGR